MEKFKKFIPAILGVLLIGGGVFSYFRAGELSRVCTEEATATVVNMREELDSTTDGGIRYVYYPIIEYQANGQTISGEISSGSNSPIYSINETLTVLYNPNKTEEFIVKGENPYIAAFIIGGIGVVFLGVGIYVIFKKEE